MEHFGKNMNSTLYKGFLLEIFRNLLGAWEMDTKTQFVIYSYTKVKITLLNIIEDIPYGDILSNKTARGSEEQLQNPGMNSNSKDSL